MSSGGRARARRAARGPRRVSRGDGGAGTRRGSSAGPTHCLGTRFCAPQNWGDQTVVLWVFRKLPKIFDLTKRDAEGTRRSTCTGSPVACPGQCKAPPLALRSRHSALWAVAPHPVAAKPLPTGFPLAVSAPFPLDCGLPPARGLLSDIGRWPFVSKTQDSQREIVCCGTPISAAICCCVYPLALKSRAVARSCSLDSLRASPLAIPAAA